jgi:predicted MPP superfamily phosphohydrolase
MPQDRTKRQLLERSSGAAAALARWTFFGQVALNVALLLAGVWLLWTGNRRSSFVVALVPLVFVPFSYARLRLCRLVANHVTAAVAGLFAVAGVGFDAVMVAQLLGARDSSATSILQAPGITWVGAVWFSAHALLLLGYALMGLAGLSSRPARRWLAARRPAVDRPGDKLIGRREVLQKAGLLGAALPFGVSLSSVPLSYDFRVETREITLPLWPHALDGLRVVHLSDIHVGGAMDRQRLLQVADLTNQCRPDLVLHTGDFLTHRLGNFDAPLYEALGRIQAPHGQWGCFGNHDFDNPRRLEGRLRDCGVTVLRDGAVSLSVAGQAVEIAGIDFVFGLGRAAAYERIIASWGPRLGTPRLLLNHDPSGFFELPGSSADLVLSGHTHGGHVGVQLSSSRAITVVGLLGLPDQGMFARGDMRLYVTRCVGFYGYPMRIGIPPEIALLILRAPQSV